MPKGASTHEGFNDLFDPFDLDEGDYKIGTKEINAQSISRERFITTGLAMWLSSFVFPTNTGNVVRAKTLAPTCQMARGEMIAIMVSWVAYFMNMMDNASMHGKSNPSTKTTPLLFHYWIGWLSCYCPESYPSRRPMQNSNVSFLFSIIGTPPSWQDLKKAHDFFCHTL